MITGDQDASKLAQSVGNNIQKITQNGKFSMLHQLL